MIWDKFLVCVNNVMLKPEADLGLLQHPRWSTLSQSTPSWMLQQSYIRLWKLLLTLIPSLSRDMLHYHCFMFLLTALIKKLNLL